MFFNFLDLLCFTRTEFFSLDFSYKNCGLSLLRGSLYLICVINFMLFTI